MPSAAARISLQALVKRTLRQSVDKIPIEVVMLTMAISGAAVRTPTTIESNGIAINASPKPKVVRHSVAKRIIPAAVQLSIDVNPSKILLLLPAPASISAPSRVLVIRRNCVR